MDKKELIIGAIIFIVAVLIASIIFAPSDEEAKDTTIELLNKGDIGENSTLYIKLKDIDENSLSDKTIHITLTDGKNVVYDKTVSTHATGVAIAELENVSSGKYNLKIDFNGDENYTNTSFSKKITIVGEEVEDVVDDSAIVEQTISDSSDTSYSSQQSYSQPSYSQQSYESSSDDSSEIYIDENGNEMSAEYDENGNQVEPNE